VGSCARRPEHQYRLDEEHRIAGRKGNWIRSIGFLSGLTGEHRHMASYCAIATDERLSNTMQRTQATDLRPWWVAFCAALRVNPCYQRAARLNLQLSPICGERPGWIIRPVRREGNKSTWVEVSADFRRSREIKRRAFQKLTVNSRKKLRGAPGVRVQRLQPRNSRRERPAP